MGNITISDLMMYKNCDINDLAPIDTKDINLDNILRKIFNILKKGELYISVNANMQNKLIKDCFFINFLKKYGHSICFFSLSNNDKNSSGVGYFSLCLDKNIFNNLAFKKILNYQDFGFDICYKVNEKVYLYIVEYADENYGYSEGAYIDKILKEKIEIN